MISSFRLLAGVHMERKTKSQKAKSKSSEGRKQLSNVRVIQRNLVYIMGLPLNLADEDVIFLPHLLLTFALAILCIFLSLSNKYCHFFNSWAKFSLQFMQLLQRREYFGQYGKVLKVSMSRTAAGVVQQFPNNTCSV